MLCQRRWLLASFGMIILLLYTLYLQTAAPSIRWPTNVPAVSYGWSQVQHRYPVTSYLPLPTGDAASLPRIQKSFDPETAAEKTVRLERQAAVQRSFEHAWAGYRDFAWGDDEVIPVGGGSRTVFTGWAATLVDSLDTLWIMGLRPEFHEAIKEVEKIDFTTAAFDTISVFETTIRFLGGLLSAYDLSGEAVLLRKATDLGDMLYKAFDTPNRMPITKWSWKDAKNGEHQNAPRTAASAEVGSMSMEFSRLSQLTGNPKYFDAVQRVTEKLQSQQNSTNLPGMWPTWVNPLDAIFNRGEDFTVSALADSLYEYLPKAHLLLGGGAPEYLQMYTTFIETAKKHVFFRVRNPENRRIQMPGNVKAAGAEPVVNEEGQHLGCFIGGLVALGARLSGNDSDLVLARELTDGCIWAYDAMPSGIMPERFQVQRCVGDADCAKWDEAGWHAAVTDQRYGLGVPQRIVESEGLQPGFAAIPDKRYLLRPEAIESVWVLYRITGDKQLLEDGWRMFEAIERATRTDIAHTEVSDVTVVEPTQHNKMESFWTAETLKYFYLLFSEPELISLDEFVLNTEAHPFRYRRPSG